QAAPDPRGAFRPLARVVAGDHARTSRFRFGHRDADVRGAHRHRHEARPRPARCTTTRAQSRRADHRRAALTGTDGKGALPAARGEGKNPAVPSPHFPTAPPRAACTIDASRHPEPAMASESSEPAAKLAVLIDADNAQPSIAESLLAEVAKYGTAHVKRAYGDWTGTRLSGWKETLLTQSIQPIQQFG